MPSTLVDLLEAPAASVPYRHLADGERESGSLSAERLRDAARAVAAGVRARCAPGTRVLIPCFPGLEFAPALLGVIAGGGVAVPAPGSKGGLDRMLSIGRSAAATAVVLPTELRGERLPDLVPVEPVRSGGPLPRPDPDALAYLQFTSGSTSRPRGVALTHRNVLENCAAVQEAYGFGPDDVLVSWVPSHHDLGLIYGVVLPLYSGATCVTLPADRFVERPIRWLQAMSRYRATATVSPNFGYDLAVARTADADRAGLDLRRLRIALNGAEPVRRATEARFAEAFRASGFEAAAFSHSYGLAEATAKVTAERAGRRGIFARLDAAALERGEVAPERAGQRALEVAGCGVPARGTLVAVVGEDGRAVPPDRIGEIWLRGGSVAAGYDGDAEATGATFGARVEGSEERWLRTGDLGFVRDGELFVTGRSKDLLVVRGENRYPQDLEWSAQTAHPAIRPGCAAAFSIDDGERERLVLVSDVYPDKLGAPDAAFAALQEAVAHHGLKLDAIALTAPHTVPKTSSGKVRRSETRRRYLAGELAVIAQWKAPESAPAEAPRPADPGRGLREVVVAVVAKRLKVDPAEVRSGQPFKALGMDSIDAVEIGEQLARALGRTLYPGVVQDHGSLPDLLAFLEGGAR